MTTKEYLSQARHLDIEIDSKIQQLSMLNDMARKCTSVMTGMPHSPSGGSSKLADTVNKIVDLQEEINREIDALVDLKQEIVTVINRVENKEQRLLLVRRYLCFDKWETIALEMGYALRYVHKLHGKALDACCIPEDDTDSKSSH